MESRSGLLGSFFVSSLLSFVGPRNLRGLNKLRGLNGIRFLGLVGGPVRGLRGATRKNLNLSLFMILMFTNSLSFFLNFASNATAISFLHSVDDSVKAQSNITTAIDGRPSYLPTASFDSPSLVLLDTAYRSFFSSYFKKVSRSSHQYI